MWQWNTSWCSNTFESKHCPLNILSISSFSSWKRLSGAGSLSFIYLIAFQLTNEGSVLIHLCFNLWAQFFIILTKIIVKFEWKLYVLTSSLLGSSLWNGMSLLAIIGLGSTILKTRAIFNTLTYRVHCACVHHNADIFLHTVYIQSAKWFL